MDAYDVIKNLYTKLNGEFENLSSRGLGNCYDRKFSMWWLFTQ